ncbi:MAG: tetratricopeptide repeat protein [Thermoguttaceae bacterium]|nr:tetratricopeptide repeat protein [Thermoguttaceae bacterium]
MLFRRVPSFLFAILVILSFVPAVRSDNFIEQLRRDVIGEYENDPERNRRLANILDRQGLSDSALPFFLRAAELDPQSIVCKKELARCLKKLNRRDEAIKIYQSIFDLAPNNSQIAWDLVSLLEESERFEESESILLRLIAGTEDRHLHLSQISQLTDLAIRHHRVEELLKTVSKESFIPNSCERALLRSQILIQCERLTEALQILEEELTREESSGEIPDPNILDHLVSVTFLTGNTTLNKKYSQLRADLYPTNENLREAEESQKRYNKCFAAKIEYYRAESSSFLQDLPHLLLNPHTRNDVIPFALSSIPVIQAEQVNESFNGIPLLFHEIFSSHREYSESAVSLWKLLRSRFVSSPSYEGNKEKLYLSLVGIPSEISKKFSDEMTADFLFLLNRDILWEGYWTANGWKSLFETILDSVTDTKSISIKLDSSDVTAGTTEKTLRAKAVILFYQHDLSEQTYELLQSLNLLSPHEESLKSDWTLFHAMKSIPEQKIQLDLAKAYLARIPLTVGTPDERFVVKEFQKASIASGDPNLINAATTPILERLERDFRLAAQTNSDGNATITDPETGDTHDIHIYEILNDLLDTAIELKTLGLSKEVVKMYHLYREGTKRWANQEGLGVFYFEELKKIVSESE